MNILIASLCAVVIAVMSYIALKKEKSEKCRIFRQADPDEVFESKALSEKWIVFLTIVLAVEGFVCAMQIFARVSDILGIIKMLIALICMTGAGCFDFREKRIPNIFPGVLAIAGLLLMVIGVITRQAGVMAYITSNVVAAFVCVVFLALVTFVTKQGIGAGDVKLIGALTLLCGVYTIIGVLFFGTILCAATAVLTLIMKRKKLSESLPFGPYLYLGFVATLFAVNF